jgi:ABC-type polysaccharide/polyol phosphate export permease
VTLLASVVFVGPAFDQANWAAVALTCAPMLVSVMGFGLFIGNFAIAFREWIVVRATGQMLLMSFSGAFVPRSDLPRVLELLGGILPLTHGLQGLRKAIDGAPPAAVLHAVALEALIGVFYIVLGHVSFLGLEQRGTRGGYDQS